MAFFWGRLSRPDEPRETPFKYLTFGVVGVDWISHPRDAVAKTAFRPRLPSPSPLPPELYGSFQIHARSVPRFPSRWRSLQWNVYPSIGQNFRQREKKGRGVFGFGLLPLAESIVAYNPSPLARPICRFSNAEPRNACCSLFGGIFGEKSIGGWIARIVDEEGIERRANPV